MIKKVNSLGCCLINKQTGILLTKKLEGIKYPQKAKSYDVVEIGRNFKPEEYKTKIITFRDEVGKIIQRNITEISPNEIIETKKSYKFYSPTYIKVLGNSNSLLYLKILGRKISSIVKKNGKYFSKSEEIQTKTKDDNNHQVLTISKINTFASEIPQLERECQSLYEYKKNSKKGYSAENYYRNNHSGLFKFSDFKEQFENIENCFQNDKYSLLYIYPFKQFKRIAPYVIENPIHKPPFTNIKWYSRYPRPEDSYISRGFYDGDVHLNSKILAIKADVVQTTAHEKEHAYQNKERQKPIEYQTEETRKNIEAYNNYVSADIDYDEYENNYNEIKAREAGFLAVNEYADSLDKLKKNFVYAPNYQFGYYH